MRGHEPLIAMRRRGVRPDCVRIDLLPAYTPCSVDWHQRHGIAQLEVLDGESIARLDLRCLVGLQVFIGGEDARRVRALRAACQAAGARLVLAFVTEDQAGELRTVEVIDSEEVAHG